MCDADPLDGLRPADTTDVPAIERLVAIAYGAYVDQIGMKPNPMIDDYRQKLAIAEVWVLGSETLDALLILVDRGSFLLIDNVAVHPDQQGHGLGSGLMAYAERRARHAGHREVRLYTNELMTQNRARYAHWGYVEIGRELINGRRAVWLNKQIQPT